MISNLFFHCGYREPIFMLKIDTDISIADGEVLSFVFVLVLAKGQRGPFQHLSL